MSKALLVDEDVLKSNIRTVIEEMVDEFWARHGYAAILPAISHNVVANQSVPQESLLNDRELQSIYALFAWVAEEQDISQETVQHIAEAKFGVNDVTKLPQKDYDEVIRFLVDLQINEMRN